MTQLSHQFIKLPSFKQMQVYNMTSFKRIFFLKRNNKNILRTETKLRAGATLNSILCSGLISNCSGILFICMRQSHVGGIL